MKRVILGWLAAAVLAMPMSAHALLVTVNGQAYDVTTTTGTFQSLSATLEAQPWWGNSGLAKAFAETVNDDLLLPNDNGLAAPAFAYSVASGAETTVVNFWGWASAGAGVFAAISREQELDASLTWATATPVPVPLPPTLYLLGLGLTGLLGLSARRRRNAEA